MLRSNLFWLVFFFTLSSSYAQQKNEKPAFAGVGYFSKEGSYPGFTLNFEKTLLSNKNLELVVNGKTGAYFHRRNHTGVFVMVQSGQRFRIAGNFYAEHFLGVGYLHSFLSGGDAYYVDAAGIVHQASNKGNPHFMPSVSVGIGYLFKNQKPVYAFMRPMIFWQIPFNTKSLVQFGLEIGANIKLPK